MTDDNKDQKPNISCAENGPLLVKGLETLCNSSGEKLEIGKVVAVCRCGGSANKPFCDGAHRNNGFSGDRLNDTPPTTEQDRYQSEDITILDNRSVCAHIGSCTEGHPGVWRLKKEPWIKPDQAARDSIVEVIRQCPSGALSFEGDEGVRREPGITILKDGPYHVTGGLPLADDVTGQLPLDPDQYTLCRCGASRNKPFCDGSHWDIEFNDENN